MHTLYESAILIGLSNISYLVGFVGVLVKNMQQQ